VRRMGVLLVEPGKRGVGGDLSRCGSQIVRRL
jgi:hypothetical protein